MTATRDQWRRQYGCHLSGAEDPIDGNVSEDLLRQVREMASYGVPARQPAISALMASRPHRSALQHNGEAFQKLWKDVRRGRMLLCTTASDPWLAGVASSPWDESRS